MAAQPCPAELPLCLCGIRGCDLAELHAAAFVLPGGDRRRRGTGLRRRKGRHT